ncbi:MAG: serine/threonine protein kinase [Armatimonadetes bacterium]|nr:serine/threonine protein kinase [Armatimonadota bacterium]
MLGSLGEGIILENRYQVTAVLGEGAVGTVYKVQDLRIPGAKWALKELKGDRMSPEDREEAAVNFRKEAEILASLSHPGLPKVIDFFTLGPRHYLVMELLEGETLDDLLGERRAPLPESEVLPLAFQICDILEYLHFRKPGPVIFRDLKPSNVMISPEGKVSLIDFGIARFFKPGKPRDTSIMGTPGFSAPEQYGRKQSTVCTDIYSFGVTLFYLLTRQDPQQYHFDFPRLRTINPTVSLFMEHLTARCVEREPFKRFQSVQELKKALAWTASLPSRALTFAVLAARRIPHNRGAFPYVHPLLGILVGVPLALALLYAAGATIFVATSFTCHPRHRGHYYACQSNLKNLATALSLYSEDHGGQYPKSLNALVPKYQVRIPKCPEAEKDTYTDGYAPLPDGNSYVLFCRGRHHIRHGPADYPRLVNGELFESGPPDLGLRNENHPGGCR